MLVALEHERYGKITYKESFWTGKRELSFGEVQLAREKRNVFAYECDGQKTVVTVKGNALWGAYLLIGDEKIKLSSAPTWYEILCSIAIILPFLVWGNSKELCSVVPIVGGAIGGGIGGAMAVVNCAVMKSIKDVRLKLAAWVCVLAATVAVGIGIAYMIIGMK